MKWFRFYNEVLHDSKVQRLPAELYRTWTNVLCIASENVPRGTLPDIGQVAFLLRQKDDKVKADVDKLVSLGLLDRDEVGTLRPHSWEKRQPESDDVAARMRESRRRKKTSDPPPNSSPVTEHVTERVKPCDSEIRLEAEADTEQKPPNPPDGGGAAATAEIAPLPDGAEQAIAEARAHISDDAAEIIRREAGEIDRQLGGRWDLMLEALQAAQNRRPKLEVGRVYSWCMIRAKDRLLTPPRPASVPFSRPADRGAPPPPPGREESKGCPRCSGEGQVAVFHPDPKGSGQPPTTSADCVCPRGRAIRKARKSDDARRIPDLTDVLAGRSPWRWEPPEEAS